MLCICPTACCAADLEDRPKVVLITLDMCLVAQTSPMRMTFGDVLQSRGTNQRQLVIFTSGDLHE